MELFEPRVLNLEMEGVRIEPLTADHAREFRSALQEDPDTMQFFTEFPASLEPGDISEFIGRRTRPGFLAHAIYADGVFAGSSSYMDIRPEHYGLEIGHTWYAPRYRRTRLNPAVKFLMIRAALELFGAMRVQLKTGGENIQSQRAMRNIGLTEEGVLHNHLRLPSGKWRDTVMFSVTPQTWPRVQSRLQELMATRPNWQAVPGLD
ncbi:MAG: GNAT family N-acetyltransferase [Armatimonadetes bacterium]|nr:GNAT family N-acetyltransferase [Armatimonadota bacterium]